MNMTLRAFTKIALYTCLFQLCMVFFTLQIPVPVPVSLPPNWIQFQLNWIQLFECPLSIATATATVTSATPTISPEDGQANLREGERLFNLGLFDEAVEYFWNAILQYENERHKGGDGSYSLEHVFGQFMRCFAIRGKIVEGYLFIARDSLRRNQRDLSKVYIKEVLAADPQNEEALELRRILDNNNDEHVSMIQSSPHQNQYKVQGDGRTSTSASSSSSSSSSSASRTNVQGRESILNHAEMLQAEKMFNTGVQLFNNNNDLQLAESYFEEACRLSGGVDVFAAACTNAIYCRSNYADWGHNGTQFAKDMERIQEIIQLEVKAYRSAEIVIDEGGGRDDSSSTSSITNTAYNKAQWRKATSVHPHMVLGYPIDPLLKRFVSESHAFLDEPHMRFDEVTGTLKTLPSHLPYASNDRREDFKLESTSNSTFKLRVGFVSSGFKSKAVLFLSHDMFRYFDRDEFELHIFSTSDADDPIFIETMMRGVDWRERVNRNVDYFHHVQSLKNDHIALAKMIHDLNIHILIDWDGYARQGERAQGLFALRPAPLQIIHQEFMGTMGGHYDYIVTDKITSPISTDHLYSEKFLYMPNHFFSKGHAVQAEVKVPTYDFQPNQIPYKYGTGSPQENRCLLPLDRGPETVSFVYCNFNKFLKSNPETMMSYIEILKNVPHSILCLLENPKDGIPNLKRFVQEMASSSGGLNDTENLIERIQFLPWAGNPYDHQMRNQDFCNVVLDSHPYNGHTTGQDALYGGVPIVTRSDGLDMASRVSTSANVVLDLEELNAYGGRSNYVNIATKLGTNNDYFQAIRNKLIDTCLQRNPLHPYWDVSNYVLHFQRGLKMVWELYLSGENARHIEVL